MGGTPFLDTQYTVFGEVVEGLEVVEMIRMDTNKSVTICAICGR
ncbi:MAG: peptidylprolyl isomerase [Bacteroidaceae bacterium]|nr:peptidylprolyl isomerase [Bacteroidaceae bacterium]